MIRRGRRRAIALGFKPPLLTGIVRTGQETRLYILPISKFTLS